MSNWSYKNNSRWSSMYPQCSSKNNALQSPIDISPSNVSQECGTKCELTIKYRPSKCYVINDHNTITINYEPGSYIIYQNTWYELTKAKIHVPSLHTFNGNHYPAEINLYHCVDNQCESGLILSIPLNRGPDYGESVEFINQFINQAPLNNTLVEREITVSEDWNIISLIPEERTCFIYNGSLPHPPCSSGWTWVVFNQPSRIGLTALKTLQHNIVQKAGENIRPTIAKSDKMSVYKVSHEWIKVFEEKPKKNNINKLDDLSEVPMKEDTSQLVQIQKVSIFEEYFNRYRKNIKNFMLFLVIILIITISIKMAKYIIRNDIVNKYLVPENLNSMNMNKSPNNQNQNMPPNNTVNENMPPNNQNIPPNNKNMPPNNIPPNNIPPNTKINKGNININKPPNNIPKNQEGKGYNNIQNQEQQQQQKKAN